MNIFHLIKQFKKVRNEVHISAIEQALYFELISICNENPWKDVFNISSPTLCQDLNISDNTLNKSRKKLSDIGLISFKTSRNKWIGCVYIINKKVDEKKLASYSNSESDKLLPYSIAADDKTASSAIGESDKIVASSSTTLSNFEDDNTIPPINTNITIKQEEIAQTSLLSPPEKTEPDKVEEERPKKPEKGKGARKKKSDEAELIFPYSSERFLATWEILRHTPKWEKKLNYALQLSLNKLSNFQEDFAIYQMERAIESNWTGVVFPNTQDDYQKWLKNGNNRSCDAAKQKPKEAGIKSIRF